MKHLFIINPAAARVKDKVNEIVDEIKEFFRKYRGIEYDIHITRWIRDATGYSHRYVMEAGEPVRIHSCGGAGTLFEIVNGTAGLPDVQIAAHPMGSSDEFLCYFGSDKKHLFDSIHNQVFSDVTPIDVIRCGYNHGISHALIGMEARSNRDGVEMLERTHLPADFCYVWPAVWDVISQKHLEQQYQIDLDGETLDGTYLSILIANGPCYGKDMSPAVDAHPNDGRLEIYLMKEMSRFKLLTSFQMYTSGNYRKIPDCILHYSGRKIKISSNSVMCLCLDGETFYERSTEFEIIPGAIDFVCPHEIDIQKLPLIYNHPEEGCVCANETKRPPR